MSNKKLLILIILSITIFSSTEISQYSTNSDEIIEEEINLGTEPWSKQYQEYRENTMYFHVYYNHEMIEKGETNYSKIVTIPTDKSNTITLFASFGEKYPTRDKCDYISSKSESDNTSSLYIPLKAIRPQQFDSVHLAAVCEKTCSFNLSFTFNDFIELKLNEPYITKTYSNHLLYNAILNLNDTSEQIFAVSCIGGQEGDGDLYIYYHRGLNNTPVQHPENILYNGEIGIFKGKKQAQAKLELKCFGVSDTVLSFTIREESPNGTEIYPDKPAKYGYLDGNIINEECFNLVDPDIKSDDEEERNYTISIVSKTGNLNYYSKIPGQSEPKKRLVKEQKAFKLRGKNAPYPICLQKAGSGATAYSIQVLHYTRVDDKTNPVVEPQVNKILYKYFIGPNQVKYIRHLKHRKETTEETNFNVREEQGFVDTYVVKCQTWPSCNYDHKMLEDGGKGIVKLKDVNGFHTYGLAGEIDEGILAGTQHLLFIACNSGIGCVASVSFFDEDEDFNLPENYEIVQVMNRRQNDSYSFEVTSYDFNKLVIKLHTFTGDSNMLVTKDGANISSSDYKQYWVGNSEIMEVTMPNGKLRGIFKIKIMADEGNFYSLRYDLIEKDESVTFINLIGGFTYIETINPEKENQKVYHIQNRYLQYSQNFVVNIIPINCKLKVKYRGKYIETNDTYFQHNPSFYSDEEQGKQNEEEELDIESIYYTYIIEFDGWSQQEIYKEQLCSYYIASSSIYSGTEMVLNEGQPFEFKLNSDLLEIRFLYPRPPDGGDVYADIKIEHKTNINMTLFVENKQYGPTKPITFSRDKTVKFLSTNIDLPSNKWCVEGQLCSILIYLKLGKRDERKKGTNLFINFKSRASVPSMIKKKKQIEDIIPNGGTNYYVFDVVKGEQGEISLNFNRGSGFLIARILKKDEVDPDYDWNGKVRLPKRSDIYDEKKKKQLLSVYDSFSKTLAYNSEHTGECDIGCEIYVAVCSDEEYHEATRTYINDYLIFVKEMYNASSETIVDVPTGDFVYGALEYRVDEPQHLNYYDYYSMMLMNDNDNLYVELQSQYSELYISLNESELPTRNKHFFKLINNGTDKIAKIPKSDFQKVIGNLTSFEGLTIYIGICAERLDEIYTAPYHFRAFIPINYSDKEAKVPDLIDMPTDQSVLCEIPDENTPCYFMIPKYGDDFAQNIYMYTTSSEITKVTIYANKEMMRTIDNAPAKEINDLLPNKTNFQQTSKDQVDGSYLSFVIGNSSNDDYIMIAVYANEATKISFMTSFRTGLLRSTINPSTWQIFSLSNDNIMNLMLPTEHSFIVNLVTITGEAEVLHGQRKQKIKGPGDSFSSVVDKNDKTTSNNKLIISTDYTFIIFYVYIKVRSEKENFDEVKFGVNGQYYFPKSDFPLMFFTKLNLKDNDVIMNFHIYNAAKTLSPGTATAEGLEIDGTIETIDKIFAHKSDPSVALKDFNIKGQFDDISNTGRILFKYEEMIKDDSKYLIVRIKKSDKNKYEYNKLDLEILFTPLSDTQYPIPINLYYFALIPKGKKEVRYSLRKADENFSKMAFEFSSSTNKISFAVTENLPVNNSISAYRNTTNMMKFNTNSGKGMFIITLTKEYDNIYLIVFSKEKDGIVTDETKTGFTFRYRSSRNFALQDLTPSNNAISVKRKSPFTISIKPIQSGRYILPAHYYISIINQNELNKKGYYQQSLGLMDIKLDFPVEEHDGVDEETSFDVKLEYYKKKSYYKIMILAETKETGERIIYPIHSPTSSKVGAVLGGVFGSIAGIAIIIFAYYYFKNHYKPKRDSQNLKNIVEQTSFVQASKVKEDYLTSGALEEIGLN